MRLIVLCFSLFSSALLFSAEAQSTTCTLEIKYSWKKDGATQSVSVAILDAISDKEEAAKSALIKKGQTERVRALELCRDTHENQTDCIAGKLKVLSPTLPFSARKALEDAAVNDCKSQVGICTGTEATEPQCKTEAPPVDPAAAEDKEKKETKGKKK